MKNTAELWKQSQGDEKAAMLNTLKDLKTTLHNHNRKE
jgi:hypothetical protein